MTTTPNPIYAYFDTGQVPTVSCVNRSSYPDEQFKRLIPALQKYLDEHVTPVWGMTCRLEIVSQIIPGSWELLFIDDADIADALGYHDLTPEGLPLGKVFVKTSERSGEPVSVTASHEIAEQLLDPAVQLAAQAPGGVWYAYELCDAPQAYSFDVDGLLMSDFVYPSWFEGFRKPKSTQFDHMNLITKPFQILPGGYMPVYKNGRWTQAFASKKDAKFFQKEEHPRIRQRAQSKLKRSKPKESQDPITLV